MENVATACAFRGNARYDASRETFLMNSDYLSLNMMISILCRVMIVTYNKSFNDILTIIISNISSLDHYCISSSASMVSFFRTAIGKIIRAIETTNADSLKRFMLMVDEIMIIKRRNMWNLTDDADKYLIENTNRSFVEDLGQAMQTESFKNIDGETVKLSVVISSLNYSVIETCENRPSTFYLSVPLSVDDILDYWLSSESSQCVMFKFEKFRV